MYESWITKAAYQVKDTKVGDYIRVMEEGDDGEKHPCKYKVIRIYPHMAAAQRGKPPKVRYFSYGDLIIAGMEQQPEEIEALRLERTIHSKGGAHREEKFEGAQHAELYGGK